MNHCNVCNHNRIHVAIDQNWRVGRYLSKAQEHQECCLHICCFPGQQEAFLWGWWRGFKSTYDWYDAAWSAAYRVTAAGEEA